MSSASAVVPAAVREAVVTVTVVPAVVGEAACPAVVGETGVAKAVVPAVDSDAEEAASVVPSVKPWMPPAVEPAAEATLPAGSEPPEAEEADGAGSPRLASEPIPSTRPPGRLEGLSQNGYGHTNTLFLNSSPMDCRSHSCQIPRPIQLN